MKKRIVCLLIACMMLSACGRDTVQDAEPVETTLATVITATPETVVTEPTIQWETKTVYLCVSQTMTQHDGSGSGTQEFEYDEYGNQIRMWQVSDSGERTLKHTEYSFDTMGNMLSSVSVNEEGNPGSRYEYTYDENGNLLSELYFNADGIVSAEDYYTYNSDGWVTRKTETAYYYDPARTFEYEFVYSEDYSSCRISSTNNGEPGGYTEETYDTAGRVTRTDNYAQDGSWKSTITYAYDPEGKILCEEHYSKNELQADYDVIYTYDGNGCLISKDVDYYYGYIMEYVYASFEILVPVVG